VNVFQQSAGYVLLITLFLFYDRRAGGRNDDFRRGVHPFGLAGFNNLRADGVRVACVNKRNGASPSRPRN
jgi:hypothetical protein